MPFIPNVEREKVDPILQQLYDVICKGKSLKQCKGNINYCVFKFLVTLVRREGSGYSNLSEIEAIPRDVEKAFHDFIFKPYERRKMEENGVISPLEV